MPINTSSVSPNGVVLSVGSLNGRVALSPAGPNKARYSYSDPNGGKAAAVLVKH